MTRTRSDDVAVAVLDLLLHEDGQVWADPGDLIKLVADTAGFNYFQASVAIRDLEELGLIDVVRSRHPQPRKANRLEVIRIRKSDLLPKEQHT